MFLSTTDDFDINEECSRKDDNKDVSVRMACSGTLMKNMSTDVNAHKV